VFAGRTKIPQQRGKEGEKCFVYNNEVKILRLHSDYIVDE
jgi:hypothetical protein